MSQSMLESQGILMSPNIFFFIWEIWGTLHMVSEMKVKTLGPQGKDKLI
jgi:hypothetical protein